MITKEHSIRLNTQAKPTQPLNDAVPDPEPAVPSLPGPDPGVFEHTPAALPEENQQ
jgi:hypothetical protein